MTGFLKKGRHLNYLEFDGIQGVAIKFQDCLKKTMKKFKKKKIYSNYSKYNSLHRYTIARVLPEAPITRSKSACGIAFNDVVTFC